MTDLPSSADWQDVMLDDDDDDKSVANDNRLLANRPLPLNDSYLVKNGTDTFNTMTTSEYRLV